MVDKQTENAVRDVVKQKRKRPDLVELQTPSTEPGEMSKMIMQAMTISHWPPIDTDDPQQVADRIDQYHRFCIDNDIKPDMPGMALAFGVSRKTLWAWENGADSGVRGAGSKPLAVRNLLKKGREFNEFLMTQMMQNGKLNPVTAIFLLKNNHEYRDQQDVVITPNNPLDQGTPEEVRDKYIRALPESTEEQAET